MRKYLQKSVSLGLGSKTLALFLQLYFIPLVALQIGNENFAIYGTGIALLNWAGLLSFGVPSQILREMKESACLSLTRNQYFSFISVVSLFLMAIGSASILIMYNVNVLEYEVSLIFGIAVLIASANIFSSLAEGELNFFLKIHIIQYCALIGSVFALITLYVHLDKIQSPSILLILLFGVTAFLKFLITLKLLIKNKVRIITKNLSTIVKSIKFEFFVIEHFNVVFTNYAPIFILFAFANENEVVKATLFVTLLTSMSTPQLLLIRPLKGIVARGNFNSFEINKLKIYIVLGSICIALIWLITGKKFTEIWLKGIVTFSTYEIRLISIFYVVHILEIISYSIDAYVKKINIIFYPILTHLLVTIGCLSLWNADFATILTVLTCTKLIAQIYIRSKL